MAQVQYPIDLGTALADPDIANAQLGYQTGLLGLQYRQDIAKSLLQDSDKPLSSGIGARGMAYRVSPLEGLARMVSGGAGAYMANENANAQQQLMRTYGQQLGQALRGKSTQTVPNPMQPNGGMVTGNNTGGQSAGDTIAFLKQQEGFSPKTYSDFKQTSIGYGTKAQPGETSITPQDAEARLRQEAGKVDDWITQNVKQPLTQNQRTALTSFGYNLGTGQGGLSDLLPNINTGNWQAVADQMSRYNRAGGQVNAGLVARRLLEGRLLRQPDTPQQAQPAAPAVQQTPWHVEGQDDNAMRLIFATDRPAWATVKAAAVRANTPTELEKALAQTGLPAQQQQQILQAWAKNKAELVQPKEGTQITYNAAGQPVQSVIPGAAEAKGQMKGAEAAAGKAGEQAAGYQMEINERAQNATGLLRTLSEMKNLNTNPGLFAGAKEDIGRFFRSMGTSDETIQKYLNVSPGNLEASQKLTAQMAIEAVRQISNRPTQMEFQRFLEANPNIFQTPEGLKRVVEFMQNSASDTMSEQKEFLKAKMGGLRPENYRDFEQLYNINRQERIAAGKFNSTPLQAAQPAQPAAPQFKEGQTATGPNGQKAVFRGGQWVPAQ